MNRIAMIVLCLALFQQTLIGQTTPTIRSGRILIILEPGSPLWPKPSQHQPMPPKNRPLGLDWTATAPVYLDATGNYNLTVSNVNDILYQYALDVSQPSTPTDDIAALTAVATETASIASGSASPAQMSPKMSAQSQARAMRLNQALQTVPPAACTTFQSDLSAAVSNVASISAAILTLEPPKGTNGYVSVPLYDTKALWATIIAQYSALTDKMQQLQQNSTGCPSALLNSFQDLIDSYEALQDSVTTIDVRAEGDHTLRTPNIHLDRTRNGTVVLTETYSGNATQASPKSFSLIADYGTLSASGGFLISTIPNRVYTSVSNPLSSSPSNVLQVSGLDGATPGLVALLNYHDPFDWSLNKPNFGLTVSAGPVIGVTNGKSDTSVFGFFGGMSVHLYKRFFFTPGVHVGQFADYPQGFTHPGQTVPTNFGSLVPTKRYTTRLAFAITFRGKDPTTLLGTSNSGNTNNKPSAGSTPGVKQ